MEGRDVATVDIPGAFMQVDIGTDLVYIRFDGVMAKVVQKLDPDQYQGCVGQERGKPAIYASLNKALYSTPKVHHEKICNNQPIEICNDFY